METNQMYIFVGKQDGLPKIFNAAVEQEVQAKTIIKSCANASVKIDYVLVSITEEKNPEKRNGLFILLEDRTMDRKLYPTGAAFQNVEDAQKWITESPEDVERKFEEVEITRPHKVLKNIFQNS